jgi:antagonist of KipI
MITVGKAPPYLTVQDLGWSNLRSAGMPVGGAMDRWALVAANLLVGNARNAAAFEWALAGGAVRFERACTLALTGAEVTATLGGKPVPMRTSIAAAAGESLSIDRFVRGRFLYIAIAGGLDVPPLLGSRSTYLPARIGGFEGRRLKTGDVVAVGKHPSVSPRLGSTIPTASDGGDAAAVRVIDGPQRRLIPDAAWRAFLASTFTVSPASDRMGYRVTSPTPILGAPADLPSEPACAGAIQLPPDGNPIVLMADGPTVGGYAKIAVVISADLARVAQRNPGETVRFESVSVREAQAAFRAADARLHDKERPDAGG